MVSDADLAWCVEQLEIKTADLARLRHLRSSKAAQELLVKIKLDAKRRFRALAAQYHPDVTFDDARKTERFRQLREVYEAIQALALSERPRAKAVVGSYKFTARSGTIRVTVRQRPEGPS